MAKLTFFLDTRGKEPSLRLALQVGPKRTTISLHTQLREDQWDGERVVNHPQAKTINAFVASRMAAAQAALYDLQASGKLNVYTINDIRNEILAKIDPNYIAAEDKGLLVYQFKTYIEKLKPSTARIYQYGYKNLCTYCRAKSINLDKIKIDEISYSFIENYELWNINEFNVKQNTVALYLSNLRSICNYAIRTEAATRNPFRNYSIKTEETRHRVLPVETLREFFTCDCSTLRQKEYQSLGKLIFLLIGINLADLYDLTEDNLTADGYIEYRRRKTGRIYKIKLEPEALEIIDKYRGTTKLLAACENPSESNFKVSFNLFLGRIGPGKPIFKKMSSYWLRHSWATIASELEVPYEVIARGLGHAWAKETEIYVRFDQKRIDAANRKVIDYVFHNKE